MKPVCVPCGREFKVAKVGAYIEELRPRDRENKEWAPYKIWVGDLFKCPGCGVEIVTAFGKGPVAEHYQKDYKDIAARVNLICAVTS